MDPGLKPLQDLIVKKGRPNCVCSTIKTLYLYFVKLKKKYPENYPLGLFNMQKSGLIQQTWDDPLYIGGVTGYNFQIYLYYFSEDCFCLSK